MRFKWQIPEDYHSDGFTPQNDPFSRRDLAQRLTNLFQSLEHGSVALIDGRWGSGKTVFCKTWYNQLRKDGIPSVYIDAFASDYLGDGFTAVSAALISAAKSAKGDEKRVSQLIKSTTEVGKRILLASAKVGIKAATLGLVGKEEFENFSGVIEDASEAAGEFVEDELKRVLLDHDAAQQSFNQLRTTLRDLPRVLKGSDLDDSDPPLIVIVDELDRCRPDFALDVLETLKHFFTVDRIFFVLVTNRAHLERSVQKRYGSGEYAGEYLQKFYDFVVDFSLPDGPRDPRWRESFVRARLAELVPHDKRDSFFSEMFDVISELANAYDLSLREIEAVLITVVMAVFSTASNELRPAWIIGLLALMKLRNPEAFRRAKVGQYRWAEAQSMLNGARWSQDYFAERIGKLLQYYLDPAIDVNDDEWRSYGQGLWSYSVGRDRIIPILASNVVERFSQI